MRIVACPNPECHKKIKEPILLSDFSARLVEQYYACPHCFTRLNPYDTRVRPAALSLAASGSLILAWATWITLNDITVWDKDIGLILFGSREGEAISLGIGMKVIYYFLIGAAILLLGLLTIHQRRKAHKSHATATTSEAKLSICPYTFGYLKKLNQNASIPIECSHCPRKPECSRSSE